MRPRLCLRSGSDGRECPSCGAALRAAVLRSVLLRRSLALCKAVRPSDNIDLTTSERLNVPERSWRALSDKHDKVRPETVKFQFVFPEPYNPVYSNGVYGGPTHHGDLVIHFFHERSNVPYSVLHKLTDDGTLSDEVSREPPMDPPIFVRYINYWNRDEPGCSPAVAQVAG